MNIEGVEDRPVYTKSAPEVMQALLTQLVILSAEILESFPTAIFKCVFPDFWDSHFKKPFTINVTA